MREIVGARLTRSDVRSWVDGACVASDLVRRVGSMFAVAGQLTLPIWASSTPAMSLLALVSNAYLDEQSAKIRAKPVPWEVIRSTKQLKTFVMTSMV